MNNRKVPLRKCVVTQERLPKKELVRVVKDKEDNVQVDLTGKANGRGAYLKLNKQVIEKAKNKKILSKVLGVEIQDAIFEELLELAQNS